MVDPQIIETIKRYLAALPGFGIHPARAILFGSFVRGHEHEWSDIDLLVVAPEFDKRPLTLPFAARLVTAARDIDVRISALPCGVEEWSQPHIRQILDVAAREGLEIAA